MKKIKLIVAVSFLTGILGAGYAAAQHGDHSRHGGDSVIPPADTAKDSAAEKKQEKDTSYLG